MNTANRSIRDFLYEAPGPKAKKRITIITALSLAALAALLALIIRQFYVTGQLSAKYWSLFTRYTTWRFLGRGLAGTVKAAFVSSIVAFALGMLFMLARISKYRVARWLGTALVELSRGIPTLLFIYFFFLVAPQFGLRLSAFWKIALPVALSASGVVGEVLRSGVNAVLKGRRRGLLQDRFPPGAALCGPRPDLRDRHCSEGHHLRLCGKLCRPDAKRPGAHQQL